LFYATVGLAVLGAKTNLSTLNGLTCGSLGVIGGIPGELNPHSPDDAIICSVDAAIQLT
jgi:hypothetical protein